MPGGGGSKMTSSPGPQRAHGGQGIGGCAGGCEGWNGGGCGGWTGGQGGAKGHGALGDGPGGEEAGAGGRFSKARSSALSGIDSSQSKNLARGRTCR